ncbi:MAG: hypothetical protein O2931_13280, partial [Planctomycetota bacterium]|nr:hypothetical protein [Planctomycetota bacterium]
MPQSLAQVWIHVIFSTKDRWPFFGDPAFREEMFRMLSYHVTEANCLNASVGLKRYLPRWSTRRKA